MTQNHCYVPLIFLDIDGVFNCQLFYHSKQFTDYTTGLWKDADKRIVFKTIRLKLFQSEPEVWVGENFGCIYFSIKIK